MDVVGSKVEEFMGVVSWLDGVEVLENVEEDRWIMGEGDVVDRIWERVGVGWYVERMG